MLHLSMLLYMVNAEQDTLYQALSVPHFIVLAGLALTAVIMLRLKRRRIAWRFDRGDLVWVHTGQDGEGCAPAEVEGRCTMGSAMGRGLRYRISYAEGYDGPQRVEDSCLRPRPASEEETAGGADEDTCVPAEEAANPANSPISIDMCEGPAATDGGDANPPSSLALSAGMRIRVLQADGRRRSGTILAHDEVRALAYIWYDAAELGDAREEQVPTDKITLICCAETGEQERALEYVTGGESRERGEDMYDQDGQCAVGNALTPPVDELRPEQYGKQAIKDRKTRKIRRRKSAAEVETDRLQEEQEDAMLDAMTVDERNAWRASDACPVRMAIRFPGGRHRAGDWISSEEVPNPNSDLNHIVMYCNVANLSHTESYHITFYSLLVISYMSYQVA